MATKIELTAYELNQSGVIKIIDYFEKRLTVLREQNDAHDAHPGTRGRIAEVKTFKTNRTIKG